MITTKRKKNRIDLPGYGREWGKLNDVFKITISTLNEKKTSKM